jgi:hypothetical protein
MSVSLEEQMSSLMLDQLWRPDNVSDYKVHFARWNTVEQPVNVLGRSLEEWARWQAWYPGRNDFNRQFIFSLAQFPSAPSLWLFGGIWRIKGILEEPYQGSNRKFYDVELTDELRPLVGRMKLRRVWKERGTRLNLENHYEDFEVAEILPARYTGVSFPGFNKVRLDFSELETLIDNARADWEAALGNVGGVYLITDQTSGRRYVGSAYGQGGIWSRWTNYVRLGHGGNEGMKALLEGHDLDYCRRGFEFALLETIDAGAADSDVIARENYWKEVLSTRHAEWGLNRN